MNFEREMKIQLIDELTNEVIDQWKLVVGDPNEQENEITIKEIIYDYRNHTPHSLMQVVKTIMTKGR